MHNEPRVFEMSRLTKLVKSALIIAIWEMEEAIRVGIPSSLGGKETLAEMKEIVERINKENLDVRFQSRDD